MHINGNDHKVKVINNNVFINAGTENTELQNWKAQLAAIVQHLPPGEDELKPLIQFLVMAIGPAKIYKLKHEKAESSHTGRYINLLIIISGKNGRPFVELEPLLEVPYIKQQTVCCSLHNEGNLLEALEAGHIFYSRHCTPENLVYDDGRLSYPVTPSEIITEMKQQAREHFNQYIQKALDFNEAAAYLFETKPSDIIVFLLHQAVELTYRGILKCLNGYDKKTHEIRVLKKYMHRCAPQLSGFFPDDTEEEKGLLDLLENAYLKARYEQGFSVSKEDVSKLLDKAASLQETAITLVSKETE